MKVLFNTKTAISTGLLLASSSTVSAGSTLWTKATETEIDACVAAVTERADYSDAMRVRHDIESSERRSIGHRLVIDTKVYGDGGVLREYRAVCVVTGDAGPLSFEMHEVATEA